MLGLRMVEVKKSKNRSDPLGPALEMISGNWLGEKEGTRLWEGRSGGEILAGEGFTYIV